jgi:hypothetical protein
MAMAAADDGAERQTCQGFFNVNGRGQDAFIHSCRQICDEWLLFLIVQQTISCYTFTQRKGDRCSGRVYLYALAEKEILAVLLFELLIRDGSSFVLTIKKESKFDGEEGQWPISPLWTSL